MYVGKELIDCTPYRVPHMYRVHRTTQEQEFNVQRLQIVFVCEFFEATESMLFRSEEGRNLFRFRDTSAPFDVQLKHLPNILTNSGESLTR